MWLNRHKVMRIESRAGSRTGSLAGNPEKRLQSYNRGGAGRLPWPLSRRNRRYARAGHNRPADLRGAMAFAVKAVIDKVERDAASGRDQLQPGDTFLFNDPYDGGTHLNDFRLVRPIYRDERVFCWIASVGHWLDIGGNVPGGFNARATNPIKRACAFRR